MEIKLKKPAYGDTYLPVESKEFVKNVLISLSGRNITDESYYDGYGSYAKSKGKQYRKAQVTFQNDSLFVNGIDIKCDISDPELISIRLQQRSEEFTMLFDFYVEGRGYSKKCVNLVFSGSIPWDVETDTNSDTVDTEDKAETFSDDRGNNRTDNSAIIERDVTGNNVDQLGLF